MKKIFLCVIATMCLLLSSLLFTACEDFFGILGNEGGNEGGSGNEGGGEIEVGDPDRIIVKDFNDFIHYSIAYCYEEDCPAGDVSDATLHGAINFELGKTYFMVLDFTVDSFEEWNYMDAFSTWVEFSPAEVMGVRLEEAATSDIEETLDSSDRIFTAGYKIPEAKGEARSYRIVFRVTVLENENMSIGVAFGAPYDRPFYQWTSITLRATGALVYKLNGDGQSYSVSSIGNTDDREIFIPAEYNYLPVTVIGAGAFQGERNMTFVSFPNTITRIEEDAFKDCTALEQVDFASPYSLSIGDRAFSGCSALLQFSLPSSVTAIGDYAFEKVPADLTLPGGVTSVGKDLLAGYAGQKLTISDGVTSIAYGALGTCTSLVELHLPDYTVEKAHINEPDAAYFHHIVGWGYSWFGALFGAPSYEEQGNYLPSHLSTVVIGGCSVLDDYAFYGCKGLKVISCNAAAYLGDYAFAECSGLTHVGIAGEFKKIGDHAFENCEALLIVTEVRGLYPLEKSAYCAIPCEEVGECAFRNCKSLDGVWVYTYVQRIRARAFEGCTGLTSAGFGVETLGDDSGNSWRVGSNIIRFEELRDRAVVARYLTQDYVDRDWSRN